MDLILNLAQLVFVLLMLSIMALFFFTLLLTWTWAQENERPVGFQEILSTTGIEWGALVILGVAQILGTPLFWESPPLSKTGAPRKQIPILLIPSLHSGAGIYRIIAWRLRRHFFSSLWPFSWRSFLKTHELLEDELLEYIRGMLEKSKAMEIRVISFGSSRPLVARVLSHASLSDYPKHWIAISSPKSLSRTMKFLSTERLRSVFGSSSLKSVDPQILIHGTHDIFCYPENVWGDTRSISVTPVGHYSVLLHPTTIQRILDEMS